MIEQLKSHWPLIQQYPWEFIWTFGAGFTAGVAAPAAWRWLFPINPASSGVKDFLKKLWGALRRFRPNEIQNDCIQALRFHEDRCLTPAQVKEALHHAHPISDITQALEQLTSAGWARWQFGEMLMSGDLNLAYALEGRGLDYARRNKFAVRSNA